MEGGALITNFVHRDSSLLACCLLLDTHSGGLILIVYKVTWRETNCSVNFSFEHTVTVTLFIALTQPDPSDFANAAATNISIILYMGLLVMPFIKAK